MLVLNAAQVRELLPMADAIGVMRDTMVAHGHGLVHQPLRTVVQPPGVPGLLMLKAGQVGGEPGSLGFKALTIFEDNRRRGLDTIQAFVALLDSRTGRLLAIIEGGVVTEVRTAAVSAVASDLLARPGAGDLALIGAGVQARSHLLALAQVRPLRRVRVWSRTADSAHAFRDWAGSMGHDVAVSPSVAEAVAGADIVCTVTSSVEPLLDAAWLAPGAHVNAVGAYRPEARELAGNVLAAAGAVVVDSRESAIAESGDIRLAIRDGDLPATFDPPELGEVLTGRRPGRTDDVQLTVFESLGLAIQDVAAAAFVHCRARTEGIGADIEFP